MKSFRDELEKLEESGLRRFLPLEKAADLINFSSNDYLGLSGHPRLIEAATEAVKEFGTGGTSSRLLAGTFSIHRELEQALAHFFSKEAALVYSSGYHANTGVLPVLAGRGDAIFFDRLCHASLLDGIRVSEARFFSFAHNDPEDLADQLKKRRSDYNRVFIVTEGVFSMDGDQPPLKRLSVLAKEHEAFFYIDEAHSVGVFGPDGRGAAAAENLLMDVDIFVGTLSKSLASQGGFVAGRQELIDLLVSRSRSFLFTTALAPACAAAARAALRLLPALEDRRRLVLEAAKTVREKLKSAGFNTGTSDSQIIPVWTGEIGATQELSAHLLSKGYFVPSIRPPTVPKGEGRVRLSITHGVVEKVSKLVEAMLSFPQASGGNPYGSPIKTFGDDGLGEKQIVQSH